MVVWVANRPEECQRPTTSQRDRIEMIIIIIIILALSGCSGSCSCYERVALLVAFTFFALLTLFVGRREEHSACEN